MSAAIQSVERAAAILQLLSGSRRLGIAELSAELGLSRGTVHGLVRTLVKTGLVRQEADTGKYQLGALLLHLGSSYLRSDELRLCSVKWAESLALDTRQVAQVGTLHDARVLIIHHVLRPADNLQTFDLGSLQPAHATALGKVLLAYDVTAPAVLRSTELPAFTKQTITTHARLERELPHVRRQGWAVAIEEMSAGDASIACPVFDHAGAAVGAIGVAGPCEQLISGASPQPDILDRVRSAARAISQAMGADPW